MGSKMTESQITYATPQLKELIDDWGRRMGFGAPEQLALHLSDLFRAEAANILEANERDGLLMLRLITDQWSQSREFALLDDGRLAWSGRPVKKE
jgi:hypothetical protein